MYKPDLEKAEEPEIKLPTSAGSSKKQESSRKTSISALLTMPKPLTVRQFFLFLFLFFCFFVFFHKKLWKILQEVGIQDHLDCLLKNLYADQEAKLETDMEQQTGSKLGKEYVKAVYCYPAYLTYMQRTS